MSTADSPHSSPNADADATVVYDHIDSASVLVQLLDQYLAELQAGRTPDKAELLARHPELAQQLEDCLAGIEFVHKAGTPSSGMPAQLGDFRIVREVGRGGMGVVYEAEQLSLKRKVALKVLRFGVTADAELMQRFQREAETVAHLHHTNIVPIHAIGCEQGVHYYAMQFIEGESLAAVLEAAAGEGGGASKGAADAGCVGHDKRTNGLEIRSTGRDHKTGRDYPTICEWALQGAEALAYAHQRGVIHRDIKPSNLILDPEGTVWLTDFGLAKRADEVTMTAAGVVMGTPRYMSPEQAAAARQPIDHRTDIYSLGATLYELATGKPVFDSPTPHGVITQILNSEPVAPRLLQRGLPRDLETIILKCLAKDPSRRYQQARDLADDLRSYLEGRSIRARRASFLEKAARWAKKHRQSTMVSGVTAVASVLLIVGAIQARSAYLESLKGMLELTTEGPSLVAEVLDKNDMVLVPSFPVPTPKPVELVEGAYRLRLAGAGQLSETWDIEINRGKRTTIPVKLFDRLLAAPLEASGYDPPRLVELSGKTYIFHRGTQGWQLADAANMSPLWPDEIKKYPEKPEEAPYPNTYVWGAWYDLLQVHGTGTGEATGRTPGLARLPDLNGDQFDDLVFASRVSPSLVGVSGRDGKVLWWYRADPPLPNDHDSANDPYDFKASAEAAGVLTEPVVVDIHGEPHVIMVVVSFGSNVRTKSNKAFPNARKFYVEAVNTRTQKPLWRTFFESAALKELYVMQFVTKLPTPPAVATVQGKRTLLLQADASLLSFDLETGAELGPAYDAGAAMLQAFSLIDGNGDRELEAFFALRPDRNSDTVTVRSFDLASRAVTWEESFACPISRSTEEQRHHGEELALPVDLNGDGKTEIILSVKDDWNAYQDHWYGLRVLDGAIGQQIWQLPIQSLGKFSGSGLGVSQQMIAGPDLDGDSWRELFVSTSWSQRLGEGPLDDYIDVHAVSGKDGRVLWRQRFNGSGVNRLQWGQAGRDGMAQLIVPIGRGKGGQPVTYVIASTGHVQHVLPEIAEPRVADLNHDGLPDIYFVTSTTGHQRLTAIKGYVPFEWRRAGNLVPGSDYDGDGTIDLLEVSSAQAPVARSGVDRRVLWKADSQNTQIASVPTLTHADVNRDGVGDIVTIQLDTVPKRHDWNHWTVGVISGRDGGQLWTSANLELAFGSNSASGSGPQSDYRYPMLDQQDLDGDGTPEILLAANIGKSECSLAVLSPSDGHCRWSIPITKGTYVSPLVMDRHRWHDLDGDKVLDLVLWVPTSINEWGYGVGNELRAISGRDGSSIWSQPARLDNPDRPAWPRTAIADLDGDGTAEVVATSSKHAGGTMELAVLNGKTGERKWNFVWEGDFNIWPPQLVDAEGNGRRVICLGMLQSNKPAGVTVFDADGKVLQEIPTSWINGGTPWAACDTNGDGKEELLFVSNGELHAYSCSQQRDLWKRAVGNEYWIRFSQIHAGGNGKSPTLVYWTDRVASGVSLDSGAIAWRCDRPQSNPFELGKELVYDKSGWPSVVSHEPDLTKTQVQRAWETRNDGVYIAPHESSRGKPVTFLEYSPPIRYRSLPWIRSVSTLNPLRGIGEQFPKSLLMLLEWPMVLVFAAVVIHGAISQRWRRVALVLSAALVLTAILAAVGLQMNSRWMSDNERYSWTGWYWIFWSTAITTGFFTVVGFVVYWLVTRVRRLIVASPAR